MTRVIDLTETSDLTEEELNFMYGDTFFGANDENTKNLLEAYYSHNDVPHFLNDPDIRIPLFPTTVVQPHSNLNYNYDIDGIVIELKDLTALKANLHYLFVGKVLANQLQVHWPTLRKHLVLSEYDATGLSALTRTFGHTLGFVDGGYQLHLTCMSALKTNPHPVYNSDITAKANASQVINNVLKVFANKLKALPPQELLRPTIMKTNLNDLKRMHVLEQDQSFLMELLMEAIKDNNKDPTQTLMVFLSKFGQKDETPLPLATIVNRKGVLSMTCHSACTVTAKDPRVDLMWSRYGLQEMVGHRGNMFPIYSMSEAANYQTNIDQYDITIERDLLDVFVGPITSSNITFVQLYATTPHVRHDNFRHPVSRTITTCGVHMQKHNTMILQRAKSYIDRMDDLVRKTGCRTQARIEAVFKLDQNFPTVLEAKDFYNPQALYSLLETNPMLLPFKDNSHGLGLRHVVQPVAAHLCNTLYTLFDECKGRGGYKNSWTAFQFELALEELFFGRPFSPQSRDFSVSLGTNSTNPNSLSKQRGFLGLSPIGSASVGENPPPINTWISDPLQQMRVQRIFTFTEALDAGSMVLGQALVQVLLCDLHERNDRIHTDALKQDSVPFMCKLVGCRTLTDLCKDLTERKAFNYPLTFGRALQLAQNTGHDVNECLQLGMMGFKIFPAIVYWDEKRHPKARWNKINYVELYRVNETPSTKALSAAYTGDVCSCIEKRGLSYSRNLTKYRDNGMPWIEHTLLRLPKDMQKDQIILTLTFISCVALLHNSDYITFGELRALLQDMTITQEELIKLQILSPLLLLPTPKVHRLNENIPYKIQKTFEIEKPNPTNPACRARSPSPEDSEPEEEQQQPVEQVIERIHATTVPANSTRWTDEEPMDEIEAKTNTQPKPTVRRPMG
ncbi:hypothetical protein Q8A67_016048 [Cirrhinus molitorella]|uniref:Uncharacterized protein n=1 Tax=Cirrhinus molitorella TaxID=172907 RepID=A0AA88THM1_9TELE|nr:hypothetical protein Q8A67_016048 [Cirrhinus molitorella]